MKNPHTIINEIKSGYSLKIELLENSKFVLDQISLSNGYGSFYVKIKNKDFLLCKLNEIYLSNWLLDMEFSSDSNPILIFKFDGKLLFFFYFFCCFY